VVVVKCGADTDGPGILARSEAGDGDSGYSRVYGMGIVDGSIDQREFTSAAFLVVTAVNPVGAHVAGRWAFAL